MERNLLVSVIIPAYNAEKTIKRCVDSCLMQTYPNIEIVVVDDGSSDGTADFVKALPDYGTKIILIQSENKGVSSARNIGIENCSGSLISFLDADDTLDCNAVQTMFDLMSENNSDIAVCCNKNVYKDKISENHVVQDFYLWEGTASLEESLKDNPATYSSCSKLYSKDFIGDTRFEVGQRIHEDSFFLFKLFMKQPVVAVKDIALYNYYATENSASHSVYDDRILDILDFAEEKRKLIYTEYPQFGKLAENVKIKADIAYLYFCFGQNVKGVKDIEKQCIKEIKELKKSYIPLMKYGNLMFFIVTHNLYFAAKRVFAFRRKLK